VNVLIWRLHRNQAYVAGAALAALTCLLLLTGIAMAHDYRAFLASCQTTRSCGDTAQLLFRRDSAITTLVDATMAVPILLGLFWGAPLLARELEAGTHNLAWTQGVTRRSWLSRNVLWALAAAAVWGAATAALVTWWRGPQNAVAALASSASPDGAAGVPVRLATFTFDLQGIAPAAYSVFAVALGIAAGSIFKRVLPAMAVTVTAFAGLRFLIAEYARPRYLTAITSVRPAYSGWAPPAGSWTLSYATLVGPNGVDYSNTPIISYQDTPAACRAIPQQLNRFGSCLSSHGFHTVITYQPASRFWALQGIEAGIFIALAAALIIVAYRVVLTRDA
jgi:hypothetical protein